MKMNRYLKLAGLLLTGAVAYSGADAQQFASRMSTRRLAGESPNCAVFPHFFPTFPSDFTAQVREECINKYYGTDQSLSFFNQVQTSYNSLSSSTNVGAQVASYNFNNGMQLGLNFAVIAGPNNCSQSGNGSSTNCNSSPNGQNFAPALTTAAAAQAAQNLLSSGNVAVSVLYPAFNFGDQSTARWSLHGNLVAREGVDLQSFTIGTNASGNDPNTHFNSWLEGAWQYDAIPSSADSKSTATIFVRGLYGLNYLSSGYAREYGFMNANGVLNKTAPIALVSTGIMVHGQYTITFSKAFGPSQYYVDSTKNDINPSMYDNFRSFSFGITYQKSSN